MGKISDAFERYEKNNPFKIDSLHTEKTAKPRPDDRNIFRAGKSSTLHRYSPKVTLLSAPDSVEAENFKIIRSRILFGRNNGRPRTILVTSPLPGEGKTFVAVNFAVSLALGMDAFVLLVDSDLRKPQAHEMLGYRNAQGLNEYLSGKRKLEDLIIRTKISKLSILPAGARPNNPAELLSSARMEDFLQEVKERYQDRFIVLDSPPSEMTAEANVLARHVDGIIFVARAFKTPRHTIKKAVQNIDREKILGVVFNGYDEIIRDYHKYYKEYKEY